jgi:3-oxoacyl-[acyl-carrier protein] reductase
MDLGLQDRVVVVTGGTRGLGFATAQALHDEGALVVVSGRHLDGVRGAVDRLGRDRAEGVVADNADPDAGQRLLAAATTRFGRLDGALLSVGGPAAGTLAGTTDEQWRAAFESVLLGGVRLLRTFAEAMAGRPGAAGTGGAIAMVLSVSARSPIAGLTTSNALRPGLAMLVKQATDEYGGGNVRVVGLMPGRIATDRLTELDALSGDAAQARARHEATIPLGRYGEPAEFGRVATFVLSPAASYLAGSLVAVDGGLLRAL